MGFEVTKLVIMTVVIVCNVTPDISIGAIFSEVILCPPALFCLQN